MIWIFAVLAGSTLLGWWLKPKAVYRPDPDDPLDDGSIAPIDHEELERAEREVREMGIHARPEDERPEDDWGPGTSRGARE